MKNKIIISAIFFILITIFLFIFYSNNNCYNFKIDLETDGLLPEQTDKYIVSDLKDKLSQVEELKEIVIFSKENKLSAYCKIYPYILNKTTAAQKIQKKLDEALNNIDKSTQVIFDYNFDAKFETFLVINSLNQDYKTLKKYTDEALDGLLGLNISKKISILGEQKRTAYIYFKNDTLQKYDINLQDIKNIIKKNNILQNSTIKTNASNSYNISTNGEIKNISDIENIAIFYKNKNFSTQFKDIFNIKEGIREPAQYFINFDDKKAQILAISKKDRCAKFIFDYKLNKFAKNLNKKLPPCVNCTIIKTNNLEKIEIYFKNRTSIYNSYQEYQKILSKTKEKNIKNILFLIGSDAPKISNKEQFFEQEKNKITILSNKFNIIKIKHILKSLGFNYIEKNNKIVILKENNLDELYRKIEEYKNENENIIVPYTDKTMQINYEFNNYNLNDYKCEKEEIIDVLDAKYDGLYLDSYYNNDVRVPIILQNEDNLERLYFYSKNYKILIPIEMVIKNSLKEEFIRIVRKNDKFIGKIIIK